MWNFAFTQPRLASWAGSTHQPTHDQFVSLSYLSDANSLRYSIGHCVGGGQQGYACSCLIPNTELHSPGHQIRLSYQPIITASGFTTRRGLDRKELLVQPLSRIYHSECAAAFKSRIVSKIYSAEPLFSAFTGLTRWPMDNDQWSIQRSLTSPWRKFSARTATWSPRGTASLLTILRRRTETGVPRNTKQSPTPSSTNVT